MAEGNLVFTGTQESLLKDVINRIVPAEEEFPGAGDLGAVSYIDTAVAPSANLRKLFLMGLSQIEIMATRDLGKGFGELSAEEKDQVLMEMEREQPDFFNALIQHTYNAYYTNPAIFPLIEYEGHPPQPNGYPPMKPLDPKLLDTVRKRGRLYRQV